MAGDVIQLLQGHLPWLLHPSTAAAADEAPESSVSDGLTGNFCGERPNPSGISTSSAQALVNPKKKANRTLGSSQYNPPPPCAIKVAPASAMQA